MINRIEVLMPYGESNAPPSSSMQRAQRLQSFAGATIGVAWNGWHCMETMKNEFQRILVEEFGAKAVIACQTGTTMPMSAAQLADARDHWDAAIVGLGT